MVEFQAVKLTHPLISPCLYSVVPIYRLLVHACKMFSLLLVKYEHIL